MAKGCTKNKYEEARKKRIEENKKRFQDLGISTISKDLTGLATSSKKPPSRTPKPRGRTNKVGEARRSSRARNLVPSYREDAGKELAPPPPPPPPPPRKRSRSSSSSYMARPLEDQKVPTLGEKARAWDAAEVLRTNLQSTKPTFSKSMLRSHVYTCFWLGLPAKFCVQHLPLKVVVHIVLEDENGSEYPVVYIADRCGLSGGWKAFALSHKLDAGDALVFELVEALRFKVYIVRAYPDSTENDGKQVSEAEGGKVATKSAPEATKTVSPKAIKNEAESRKGRKRKHANVIEIIDLTVSEDNVPESDIGGEVKSKVSATKSTRVIKGKAQKKPKEEEASQVEGKKPKASTKPSTQPNKGKKLQGSSSGLVLYDEVSVDLNKLPGEASKTVPPGEASKTVPPGEASKTIPVTQRKKPAPKLFRKRA